MNFVLLSFAWWHEISQLLSLEENEVSSEKRDEYRSQLHIPIDDDIEYSSAKDIFVFFMTRQILHVRRCASIANNFHRSWTLPSSLFFFFFEQRKNSSLGGFRLFLFRSIRLTIRMGRLKCFRCVQFLFDRQDFRVARQIHFPSSSSEENTRPKRSRPSIYRRAL